MRQFNIFFGLGGGFGSINEGGTLEFKNEDEANRYAYEMACDDYENYVGMYGLRETCEIMEEDEVDYETACEIYKDERESWLDYYVEEVK